MSHRVGVLYKLLFLCPYHNTRSLAGTTVIGLATVSAGLPVRKVGAARDVQLLVRNGPISSWGAPALPTLPRVASRDDPAVLGAAAEVVKFLNAQNGATYQKVRCRVGLHFQSAYECGTLHFAAYCRSSQELSQERSRSSPGPCTSSLSRYGARQLKSLVIRARPFRYSRSLIPTVSSLRLNEQTAPQFKILPLWSSRRFVCYGGGIVDSGGAASMLLSTPPLPSPDPPCATQVWVQLWREASQKYKVMLLPTPEDQKSGIPRDSL